MSELVGAPVFRCLRLAYSTMGAAANGIGVVMDANEWVVQCLTLVADNDAELHGLLSQAAAEAVREGMGTGVGRDEYDAMLRGRGAAGYERRDYAAVVGVYVKDVFADWVERLARAGYETHSTLLGDVLDLGDRAVQELLGEHYMPESTDDWWVS